MKTIKNWLLGDQNPNGTVWNLACFIKKTNWCQAASLRLFEQAELEIQWWNGEGRGDDDGCTITGSVVVILQQVECWL